MRRILLTTDTIGGVWTYTIDLATLLSRRNVAIDLATLGPPPSRSQRDAAIAIPGLRLHVTALPLEWTVETRSGLASITQSLASLARDVAPELIQLHSPALVGNVVWPAPILAMLHSCVGTWWRVMRSAPPPPDFAWRMDAVGKGLDDADAIIAPTTALADLARAVYGTTRPITIVHNGRPTGSPGRAAPRPAAQRFGILAAGRLWDEAKNIALLDHAAARLPANLVTAAGPTTGPNGASIALTAIVTRGPLDPDAMAGAVGEARIFASPARYEPFGLAILEAAAAGCALVLADIPSFRELWDDAAVFLPPDNPVAWAETLADLHADPSRCDCLATQAASRARRYAIETFDHAMWHEFTRLAAYPALAPTP